MGDVVVKPNPHEDFEFIADLARFREGLLDEKAIRKKFRLADDVWEKLALDDELVRAVEAESTRRIRTGQQKKERAQQFAVKVPQVAASIAFDENANPRHRLDAGALIDKLAGGPEAANVDSTRFVIQINLGADTLTFNKSIRPLEPGEVDPDDRGPDVDTGVIAAIANKKDNGGGGQPI